MPSKQMALDNLVTFHAGKCGHGRSFRDASANSACDKLVAPRGSCFLGTLFAFSRRGDGVLDALRIVGKWRRACVEILFSRAKINLANGERFDLPCPVKRSISESLDSGRMTTSTPEAWFSAAPAW
uniref:Uncharacterized protein n=1 Tax=Chrysotila carterae TaxID=13221 RepID=A0A7S4BBK3_CHRCT